MRFVASFTLTFALVGGCGDDGGNDGPSGPSDPEITEHLRRCAERCDQDTRCLSEPPTMEACLAQCDAMAIEDCIEPHTEYFDCTSLVACDAFYDDRLVAGCGDELRALSRACEPWREPPE